MVCLALAPACAGAATLSLADAVAAALRHSLTAESARLERAQGRQALAEGVVSVLPDLGLSYATTGETVGELNDTWHTSFTLSQPVVDAAVVFSVVRGVRENDQAKREAAQTVADLILKVETAYYDTARAQALVASGEKQYRRASEHLKTVETMYELKEANLTDKLQAESDALTREANLLDARNQLGESQRVLSDLIGAETWAAVAVEELATPEPPAGLAATVISETTLARDPDLSVLEAQLKTSDATWWGAWGGLLPALAFSYSRGSTITTSGYAAGGPNQRYGLAVSFPVVDAADRVLDITGARLDREQARLALAEGRRDARQRLARSLAGQELAYKKWGTAAKTVALNEEAVRLKARSYELGDASFEELLEVEAALADAERTLVEAQTSYWSYRADLNYVLGVAGENR